VVGAPGRVCHTKGRTFDAFRAADFEVAGNPVAAALGRRANGIKQRTFMTPSETPEATVPSVHSDLDLWLHFNRSAAFESEENLRKVAPFPPPDLMHTSSGCKTNQEFAAHGVHFLEALWRSSPMPLTNFDHWLDFGVGVGRLARMFKGFHGHYTGVDIDPRNIDWVSRQLPWVEAVLTQARKPLPIAAATFNAVSSVSVFTHMNEEDHAFYLSELKRVCLPGAYLFLTVCGETALVRAENEENTRAMMAIYPNELNMARKRLDSGNGFYFGIQNGHLTSRTYAYGNTFIGASYIMRTWCSQFRVVSIWPGGIHDFQDIIVLQRQ
jgi:SAM-dependent methyltransferase